MKQWLTILLFLSAPIALTAQQANVNFGLLYYELYEKSLPQNKLERILNTFALLGDKDLALQEVMKFLLFNEGRNQEEKSSPYVDSLRMAWANDFSNDERVMLSTVPALTWDITKNVWTTVWMTTFAKAFDDSTSVLEANIELEHSRNQHFPNKPQWKEFVDPDLNILYAFWAHSRWYLEHPEEYAYFDDILKSLTRKHTGGDSEADILEFIRTVHNDAMAKDDIYTEWLPSIFEEAKEVPIDISSVDSIILFWRNDFTPSELTRLAELPEIDTLPYCNAWNMQIITLFAIAEAQEIPIADVLRQMDADKAARFPHQPNWKEVNDPELSLANIQYRSSKWALKYPNEMDYFVETLTRIAESETGRQGDAAIVAMARLISDKYLNSNSPYAGWVPKIHFRDVPDEEVTDALPATASYGGLRYAYLCRPDSMDEFIGKAYELVFGNPPSEEVRQALNSYIEEEAITDPRAIYLALIYARYE